MSPTICGSERTKASKGSSGSAYRQAFLYGWYPGRECGWVWRDIAVLRTIAGQDASLRRFQCTAPMPPVPANFQLPGRDGRGSVRRLRGPGSNRRRASVRIDDPKGGCEGYTFTLIWRGSSSPGWPPASTKREVRILSHILNVAVKQKRLSDDPCRAVELPVSVAKSIRKP